MAWREWQKFGGIPKNVHSQGKTKTFNAEIGKNYVVSFGDYTINFDKPGIAPIISGADVLFNSNWQGGADYLGGRANIILLFIKATSTEVTITADFPALIVAEI